MELGNLTKPRFILAAMALLIVGALMGIGRVDQTGGLTVIIGVLAAFGAYTQSQRAQRAAAAVTASIRVRLPMSNE
jgi:type IV secretory pathway VirB2 component (pilin)